MNPLSPFPHDDSYDAEFVNGELFDGTDDLSGTATTLREAHVESRETESWRALGSPLFNGNDDLRSADFQSASHNEAIAAAELHIATTERDCIRSL